MSAILDYMRDCLLGRLQFIVQLVAVIGKSNHIVLIIGDISTSTIRNDLSCRRSE